MSEEATVPPTGNDAQARDETRPQRRASLNERPSFVFSLIGYLAKGLGIVACIVFGFFVARELGFIPTAGNAQEGQPQARGQAGPAAPLSLEDATLSGEQRATLALAKAKQQRFIAQSKEVLGLIDEWLKELKGFETEAAALLKNDDGKALAANTELLTQFGAVFDADRPGRQKAEDLRLQAEKLAEAIHSSLKDPSDASIPSDDLTKQLAELLAQAKDARNSFRKAREQIDSLGSKAKLEGTPGRATLREALTELRREEAVREAKIIETERAKARDEATRKVAQEKADYEKKQGEQAVLKLQDEKKRMLDQARRETLLANARNPAIQAKFQPFLAKGKYRFVQGDNFVNGVYGERLQPASLSILERNGYLRDVQIFALGMAGRRSDPNIREIYNDRPIIPYPTSEADWRRMEQLYEQFKELAPVWVELDLLLK